MVETWAQRGVLVALAAVVLAFLDTPLRTFRQRYTKSRWAERLVLLSIEANVVLVWAMVVVVLRRDVALGPVAGAAPLAVVGALLAVAGATLAIAAKLRLGRWFSANLGVKPGHELVTSGPYAIVRHPMYTGLLAIVVGAALAWRSGGTLALAAALALPFWLHTAVEEPMFVEHFGDAYRDYQRRVPRLVPGWRPRPPAR